MNDKEAAYILFKEGVPQGEIAKVLNRSEVTISRWKKKGEWDKKAADELMMMETISDGILDLVRYQLKQLKLLKEKYLEEGGIRLIAKGDIDGIRDLYNMVKGKETDFTTLVRIVRQINDFMKNNNPDLARQVAPVLNAFLNEKRGGNHES